MSQQHASTQEYYRTWSKYKVPFKPIDKISQEEALTLETYYVASYTEGKLVSFAKFYQNHQEWKDDYVYHDNGRIKRRKMIKSDGSTVVQDFDKKGNLIKE